MKRNEIVVYEHKKGVRAVKYNQKPQSHIELPKPRNPVAKNSSSAIGGGAAGAHKDAKKASQAVRGQKHKNAEMAEAYPGHIQKGKELDAATKKIQKKLDKRIKKVDKGVAEMDKSQKGAPGWNIDDNDHGPEGTAKAVKAKEFAKKALDILNKEYNDEEWYDRHGNPNPKGAYDAGGHYHMDRDVEEMYGRKSSYYNPMDYERDQQRQMDYDKREFKRQELQHELGHERNNIQVVINGKKWKVLSGKGYADSPEERMHLRKMQQWADNKSASTGKKWEVYLTGADPTVDETTTGKVTASGPQGIEITNPASGVKTTLPTKMASALAPKDGAPNQYTLNPQAVAGSDGGNKPEGPKVGSEVTIPDETNEQNHNEPPSDSTSPIHGDTDGNNNEEHDMIISLLKKLLHKDVEEMDNGPVSVQTGSKGDLGQMRKLAGL